MSEYNLIISLLGGIIAGFFATLIYEIFRKPNISIEVGDDKWDEWNPEDHNTHTLHIKVKNRTRCKIISTREAMDVWAE